MPSPPHRKGALPDDTVDALTSVTGKLPGGGELRDGQVTMARAVAEAIESQVPLVVQAGTGTGKSLAYLIPAILSGRSVVVATATKALQEQLASKDLPFLARNIGAHFTYCVLKGRSNYLCAQKFQEVSGNGPRGRGGSAPAGADQLPFPGDIDVDDGGRRVAGDVRRILSWARSTRTGDMAELDFEPDRRAWAMLSTASSECPGTAQCPSGADCHAESARMAAVGTDVTVVNTHLYLAHLASGGGVLPHHDVVVFDEAHQLEDVATSSLGIEVGGGAFRTLARQVRTAMGPSDADLVDKLAVAGERIDAAALAHGGGLLAGSPGTELVDALTSASARVNEAIAAVRAVSGAGEAASPGSPHLDDAHRGRALAAAVHLGESLTRVSSPREGEIVWIEEKQRSATVRLAPVDVGAPLATMLWPEVTAILTSATIPSGYERRLGMDRSPNPPTVLDVGSPFPYATNSLLYCAAHLPDPRAPGATDGRHAEIAALVHASRGRALVLFTSWNAMRAAVDDARARLPYRILAQGDLPKNALLDSFAKEPSSCLFATMSFWQGVDVVGEALSLVVIDRIPFPRPDEPLMQARRERAGSGAFRTVDIPRAAMMLAQGAGRLIRSATDRGVVAVLDPRLATANYRSSILAALPPMKRTVDIADVEKFFADA